MEDAGELLIFVLRIMALAIVIFMLRVRTIIHTRAGGRMFHRWRERMSGAGSRNCGGNGSGGDGITLGSELHAQYIVNYAPSGERTAGFHEVKVAVGRPNVTVRTRLGYFVAAPRDAAAADAGGKPEP